MNALDKKHVIVHLLISASIMHRRLFDEALLGAGIHGSQHRTLRIIEQAGSPPSQKEIAERLDISAASAAVTLKKLEKNGYITRVISNPDNRRNEISITEKGKNVLENTFIAMSHADKQMFCGFTDDELDTLEEYLSRINDNLKNTDRKDIKK